MQGEWLCASCTAGEPPPPQQTQTVTLRQKLLGRAAGLAVVRLEALWKHSVGSSGSGSSRGGKGKGRGRGSRGSEVGGDRFTFSGRWYCLPEDTCRGRQASLVVLLCTCSRQCFCVLLPCASVWNLTVAASPDHARLSRDACICRTLLPTNAGTADVAETAASVRQAHHNARELMLTQLVDTGLECDTLLRPCAVAATASQLAGAAGDDVFMCDHIYDTAWEVSVAAPVAAASGCNAAVSALPSTDALQCSATCSCCIRALATILFMI